MLSKGEHSQLRGCWQHLALSVQERQLNGNICLKTSSSPDQEVVQLVGRHPAKQSVAGLILGEGTCLGCGFSPHSQGVNERHWCFSPFLSPSLPLSLKINNFFLKKAGSKKNYVNKIKLSFVFPYCGIT